MKKSLLNLTIIFLTTLGAFAQTSTSTPKTIESGVINGKAVSLSKPPYPAIAKEKRISGEVKIRVTIDEQGNVISAEAVSGPVELHEVSEKAALTSKFSPTTLQGQPVKVTGTIIYRFQPAPQSNEEILKFMGIGVGLTAAKIIPMNEWESFPLEEFENETVLKDILKPLATITSQTNVEERLKILSQVKESLDKKLTGDDAWQFKFGQEFGEVMLELQKVQENFTENFDELAVKHHLLKMKELIKTAPASIPSEILGKFNEIADLANIEKFNSDGNLTRLFQLIGDTINLISPNLPN